jgi:hypothetical protein
LVKHLVQVDRVASFAFEVEEGQGPLGIVIGPERLAELLCLTSKPLLVRAISSLTSVAEDLDEVSVDLFLLRS